MTLSDLYAALAVYMIAEYLVQPEWLRTKKAVKGSHLLCESFLFMGCATLLTLSPWALAGILVARVASGKWNPAKYVCFVRNNLAPKEHRLNWYQANITGFGIKRPYWHSHRRMMIIDAMIHVAVMAALVHYV